MNIYDIAFIAIVALFLVVGLFSKLLKGLINLIAIGASIPVSYWVSGILMNTSLPQTLFDFIEKIEIVKTLIDASESLNAFLHGSMRTVVFYVVGLLGLLVFKIVAAIIWAIFKNGKLGEPKGMLSLGLFRALAACVALIFITSPIPILHTGIKEATTFMSEKYPDGKATQILQKVNEQVEGSLVVKYEIQALDSGKVPFLTYEVVKEDETKECNFYSDMEDIGTLIPSAMSLKDLISGFNTSINLNDAESITNLINKIGEALDAVDSTRSSLKEDGSFKGIIGELVKYFIEVYPEDKDSLAFLRNAKNYLSGYDYENSAYKDKLPSVIIQSYIDSMEQSNSFAKYIDVTQFTFDDLKSEVANLPELMKTFNNLSEVNADTLKNTLTSSLLAKQVVQGMLDDYYTDDSVNETDLTYDDECEAISTALHYSNNADDDVIRQAEALATLVDKLCDSDLLPAVIYSYEANGTPLRVSVDATQKGIVDGLLDTKLASGDITLQQYNTYKAIFVIE